MGDDPGSGRNCHRFWSTRKSACLAIASRQPRQGWLIGWFSVLDGSNIAKFLSRQLDRFVHVEPDQALAVARDLSRNHQDTVSAPFPKVA